VTAVRPIRLGLQANLVQFALLVAVSALVGGMVGQERTVLPLLATDVFGLTGFVSALTFVVAFGIAKAFTNPAAGALGDRFGRKPVLVAGCLIGLPAARGEPGLTWSTTVIMKIDLVGPVRRGLATGINEAAGYGALAFTALVTGWIAAEYGLRPGPFLVGLSYAILGLGASILVVRETRGHVGSGRSSHPPSRGHRSGRLRGDGNPVPAYRCQPRLADPMPSGSASRDGWTRLAAWN
jgi:MFS family permease